jgi:transglutaminase-like putative cysteine protease
MFHRLAAAGAVLTVLWTCRSAGTDGAAPSAEGPAPAVKRREFFFMYSARVVGLEPGQFARVWLPVPPTDQDQVVTVAQWSLPGLARLGREAKYANKILYVEAHADEWGTVPLALLYRVKRQAAQADVRRSGATDAAEDLRLFLRPDANVPVGGAPLKLLAGRELPRDQLALGRALFDVVDAHLHYDKTGVGWGRGDALWAYASGRGNCTDFHSLFIALARSKGLPAKFEIGFRLPEARAQGEIDGYCCWAKFKPDRRGWVPLSISEANKDPARRDHHFGTLSEDRVLFSVGRDLELAPKQEGAPLNFFVYPYAEVEGQPYPADRVKTWFAYQDAR